MCERKEIQWTCENCGGHSVMQIQKTFANLKFFNDGFVDRLNVDHEFSYMCNDCDSEYDFLQFVNSDGDAEIWTP